MPLRVHTDAKHRFMLAELQGQVSVADYVGSAEAFVDAVGNDPTGWRFLGDFRPARGVDPNLDADVFRSVAIRLAPMLDTAVDLKAAWVVTHPLTLALIRMHNSFGRHPEENVFHLPTMPEALSALGISESHLPKWASRT